MKLIVIVILLTVCIVCICILEKHCRLNKIKKYKEAIIKSFGKNQKQSFERDLLERDWDITSLDLSKNNQIDDITWNDLEMDQIYCKINNCKSFAGDQILYSSLHKIGNHGEEFDAFKRKIDFFEIDATERTEIWYIISGLGKKNDSYYLPVFINNLEAFKIPHIEYYHFMRVLLFVSFLPAIVFVEYSFLMFPIFVALINMVIYAFQKNKYEAYLNMLSSSLNIMKAAKQIVDSSSLKYEREFHDLGDKIAEFRKLFFKINKLQHRSPSNLLGDATTLLESFTFGITLWDLVHYDKVICQFIRHRKELMALYRTIGEIDTAIAVASFRKNLPIYSTPIFCSDNDITAEDIYHPLIEQPVYNSVIIKKGCIITGSNASGKSTFIKALAINALLAQSIHTCAAKKFVMPFSEVITSIAVRDEVSSGESYYIKEIKYIKRIIDALNNEKPVLCIIDEILRGTNTEERIAASVAILEYLHEKNCIVVIATHDIELTEMLKDYYKNFHFREQIRNKEIFFEYKILHGPATSRNAIKLLEYMDFPEKVVQHAVKIFNKNT